MQPTAIAAQLATATTLDELFVALESLSREDRAYLDPADLPTFGGEQPYTADELETLQNRAQCVGSWDADRLLVWREQRGWEIVAREDGPVVESDDA